MADVFHEGLIGRGVSRFLFGTAGTVAQTALGTGEGLAYAAIRAIPSHGFGTVGRYTGRLAGGTVRTAADLGVSVATPVAKEVGKMALHDTAVVARRATTLATKVAKGTVNAFTKDTGQRKLDNLFTGRQFRGWTVPVGEALPFAIAIGAGMMAANQVNTTGNVYGDPRYANEVESNSYDGLASSASGDLTLALSKNRRG